PAAVRDPALRGVRVAVGPAGAPRALDAGEVLARAPLRRAVVRVAAARRRDRPARRRRARELALAGRRLLPPGRGRTVLEPGRQQRCHEARAPGVSWARSRSRLPWDQVRVPLELTRDIVDHWSEIPSVDRGDEVAPRPADCTCGPAVGAGRRY